MIHDTTWSGPRVLKDEGGGSVHGLLRLWGVGVGRVCSIQYLLESVGREDSIHDLLWGGGGLCSIQGPLYWGLRREGWSMHVGGFNTWLIAFERGVQVDYDAGWWWRGVFNFMTDHAWRGDKYVLLTQLCLVIS